MLEKLTETITKFKENPMEALKGVIDEKQKLQNAVLANRPSTKVLVEHLEKNYTKEQILDIIGGHGSLQDFIENKMSPSFGEHLLSEVTQPFTAIQSAFGGSDIGSLIDEYASLFHKQPCDPEEIEERMKSKRLVGAQQETSNKPQMIDDKKAIDKKTLENNNVHTPPIENKNSIISPEIKEIVGHIEIKESFANIKEIKYEGNVILSATGESPYINKDALPDLIGFALAFYKKTGDALSINSAYRDIDHQEVLYKKYKSGKGNLAAAPGKSGHNLGLSIDIHAGDRYSTALGGIQGLREMAKEYNFSPIESEDRHFDHKLFVDMKSNDDVRMDLAEELNEQYKNIA